MKFFIEIDSETADPNTLGEMFRDIFFPGEGYGCYSTFDVHPLAQMLPQDEVLEFYKNSEHMRSWEGDEFDIDEFDMLSPSGYRMRLLKRMLGPWDSKPMDAWLYCFWFWDGDGVLDFLIKYGRSERALLHVQNSDCKKNYRWERV